MKKPISLILSALLAASVSMIGCSATDNDAWKNNTGTVDLTNMTVSGNGITASENTITITKGGDFTLSGTLQDGMIYVNSDEKVKLRLSGANISNSKGPAIFFDNVKEGLITITENTENYLSDGSEYETQDADAALFSNDDLEIKGSGTLTIDANYKHGIASDDSALIENGNITVNSYEHGIKVNDDLVISEGDITVTSETGKGMKAELALTIDGGNINITTLQDEGIESKGTLTVNGGNINITSAEDGINTGNSQTSTEATDNTANRQPTSKNTENQRPTPPMTDGSERPETPEMPDMSENGKMPSPPAGERGRRMFDGSMPDMYTNGEQAKVPANEKMPTDGKMPSPPADGGRFGGFGMVDEETAAAHAITINGGKIYINAKGDGIDSNGNLIINGGEITIDGPTSNGNGPLDAQGSFEINGGTVITTSSAGMIQLPHGENTQNTMRVVLGETQNAGTTVSVKDSDGTEIMSVIPSQEYQALIFSSSKLETNKEYTIYLNGEKYESFTQTNAATSVGNGGFGGGQDRFGKNKMPGGNRPGSENVIGENSSDDIEVSVNGSKVNFAAKPVIKNNSTLVGFRAILEALGASVNWDEETRSVTAKKDGITIKLSIGSDTAYVNGAEKTLSASPEIVNDSTMVPVRFLSENLGMDVSWDEVSRKIAITSSRA